jgi:hypothetical protein
MPVTDCCEACDGCGQGSCLFSIAANEARSSGEVTESVTDVAKATNEAVNLRR